MDEHVQDGPRITVDLVDGEWKVPEAQMKAGTVRLSMPLEGFLDQVFLQKIRDATVKVGKALEPLGRSGTFHLYRARTPEEAGILDITWEEPKD